MSTDFSNRTGRAAANGRINIGLMRTKRLKALIHWIQDFYRISREPTIVGLNEALFKRDLDRALARAEIRNGLKDQTKTAADAASPGPLKSEKYWKEWDEKFINYVRSFMGVNGVPLEYIIRENEDPDHDGIFPDFISRSIACAPLSGEYYDADKLTVFNMIVAFTAGQPSGEWIKNTLRYSDGRRSIKALRAHFAGEGNASRNLAEAERLQETLHYKNERAMPFETFLDKCQKMFNIYDKEGEPMADEAKVRFLFKKIEHPGLQGSLEALRAQQTTGSELTYTMAANHLTTRVSELPDYISKNRSISAVGNTIKNDKGSGSEEGIYDSNGKIKTGFIPNWNKLSKEDRNKVFAERKRLRSQKKNGEKNENELNPSDTNRLNQLVEQNKKFKRQIKALKRKNANDGDDSDEADPGDQFGGKESKRKRS